MRRILWVSIGSVLLLALVGLGIGGSLLGAGALQPQRRPFTPELRQRTEQLLRLSGATWEDLVVRAEDGVQLRGWKVRAGEPNGEWVLLFHGQSDNRAGMIGQAQLLLSHGYNLVMMDSREHGESEGTMATYGWLERNDTRAIVNSLYETEKPAGLFALGSSMGAAIALQSAAIEPRIAGVVAESSFSSLREVTYDYAGLHWSPWLGKTIFRPAVWTAISAGEKKGGFSADEVSPEIAVAARPFPVLLICDMLDRNIPCRHSERILEAAKGPKELWEVENAAHTAALGAAPQEYERRVIVFLERLRGPG